MEGSSPLLRWRIFPTPPPPLWEGLVFVGEVEEEGEWRELKRLVRRVGVSETGDVSWRERRVEGDEEEEEEAVEEVVSWWKRGIFVTWTLGDGDEDGMVS